MKLIFNFNFIGLIISDVGFIFFLYMFYKEVFFLVEYELFLYLF